jgi:hypothetical protein
MQRTSEAMVACGFERLPHPYRYYFRRAVGPKTMCVEIYYEYGGSWLPEEGFYVKAFMGEFEGPDHSIKVVGELDWVIENRWVSRKALTEEEINDLFTVRITEIRALAELELRKAHRHYETVKDWVF